MLIKNIRYKCFREYNCFEYKNYQFSQKIRNYDTEIGKIEKKMFDHDAYNKHITTQEFNKLSA